MADVLVFASSKIPALMVVAVPAVGTPLLDPKLLLVAPPKLRMPVPALVNTRLAVDPEIAAFIEKVRLAAKLTDVLIV